MKIFIVSMFFLLAAILPSVVFAQIDEPYVSRQEVLHRISLLEEKLRQTDFTSKKWLRGKKKVKVDTSNLFLSQVYFPNSSCQYHVLKDGEEYSVTMNTYAIRAVYITDKKFCFNMTPTSSLVEKSTVIEWSKSQSTPELPQWQLNRIGFYLSEYLAVLKKVGI